MYTLIESIEKNQLSTLDPMFDVNKKPKILFRFYNEDVSIYDYEESVKYWNFKRVTVVKGLPQIVRSPPQVHFRMGDFKDLIEGVITNNASVASLEDSYKFVSRVYVYDKGLVKINFTDYLDSPSVVALYSKALDNLNHFRTTSAQKQLTQIINQVNYLLDARLSSLVLNSSFKNKRQLSEYFILSLQKDDELNSLLNQLLESKKILITNPHTRSSLIEGALSRCQIPF